MRRMLLPLMLVLLAACSINTSPGDGEKIGQVVKISKVGIIGVTWEAQLIRGGMSGGSGSFGTTPFDFTIESDSLAKVVTDYMDNQIEAVIKYHTEGLFSPFRSESQGHFLVSIVPMHKVVP